MTTAQFTDSAAFRYGASVFEGIRAVPVDGDSVAPLGLDWHLDRLHQSHAEMYLADAVTNDHHIDHITKLVRHMPRCKTPFGIRIFVYGRGSHILSNETET